MKNDSIPPNPHPVKPPPNLPKPRTESLQSENARLKAEVERLNTLCKQVMSQHSDISCENIMLRKAGDAMAFSIQFNEEMAQDYNGPTIVHQSVQRWNAAKEGKPSETKSPSFIEDLGNGVEKHDLLFRYPAKEGKPSV